jgi:hypothetical protein
MPPHVFQVNEAKLRRAISITADNSTEGATIFFHFGPLLIPATNSVISS